MDYIKREVLGRVTKADDLEVHVCRVTIGDRYEALDIREFVPSLDTYGRGVTLPWQASVIEDMRTVLGAAAVVVSVDA